MKCSNNRSTYLLVMEREPRSYEPCIVKTMQRAAEMIGMLFCIETAHGDVVEVVLGDIPDLLALAPGFPLFHPPTSSRSSFAFITAARSTPAFILLYARRVSCVGFPAGLHHVACPLFFPTPFPCLFHPACCNATPSGVSGSLRPFLNDVGEVFFICRMRLSSLRCDVIILLVGGHARSADLAAKTPRT